MRELCGSNILRLPGDLPKLEIQKATNGEKNAGLSVQEIMSRPGEWFGTYIPPDNMPSRRAELHREILANLDHYARQKRRRLRSQLSLKKKSSRETWRVVLSSGAQSTNVPYPYNLLSPEVVIDWFLEEISDAEFRKEVLKIANDPYITFKYLIDGTENRQGLYDAIRNNGYAIPDETENRLIEALSLLAKSDINPNLNAEVSNFFSQPSTLRRIMSSYDINAQKISDRELPKIVKVCPSLFTSVVVMKEMFASRAYAYLSRIRAGNTSVKLPNPSDFGDLMHCHYAPYFDVFRCDASFSSHLKRHKLIQTRIAARIADVEAMLLDASSGDKQVA
jgi:hypothetical protein